MTDLIETLKKVGYALDLGYWLVELESRLVYWPSGLGRSDKSPAEIGYHGRSLDKLIAMIDEPDQKRFLGFLAEILQSEGCDRTIELVYNASWGEKVQLRLAGRQVGRGKTARIIGFVEAITRTKEISRLAKSLSFIIEALFISTDDGVIIFDRNLHIRRLNRNALELFSISDADESNGEYSTILEDKLPKRVRESLVSAVENSVAISGTFSLGGLGSARMSWRATPWGSGSGELSGIVMVVAPKRLPRLAELAESELQIATPRPSPPVNTVTKANAIPAGNPDHHNMALEWIKHPVALVSISSGEIIFANRSAREFLRIPPDKRCFVENLFDLSGFECDPVAGLAAGGTPLILKLGARVGRMIGYDDDILFMEYSPEIHQFRPTAGSIGAKDGRSATGQLGQDKNLLTKNLAASRSLGLTGR